VVVHYVNFKDAKEEFLVDPGKAFHEEARASASLKKAV
jgi:hypothetical protein